ncbi:30S ribosomal protein S2 [Candidatus Falkowbacteria bacterium RIFCSPLOWO2_02_FULL_45_15]|uniref:Small ribosomal subunit protein uS2 n=2 Tax=Candidatus Falkowiibacteriota TaxID=1752728 RepID=A0A1F5RNB5_9BACT|nr:MAG: 30S ribosomal protein S2 [Candidatus Falkowbacteria bacterium RIFCSPHIGHO2_02_FULL_45_15]OGF20227.1 MAG: 30S ribosomal protein S2 [Candidatus Falkowbacteria bacterium RIFCSPLOWO2_02_FULL_45_15]
MVKIPTLEEMLKAGMHFGHRTSKWHPKMAPFIFGQRAGVHIIDLQKTQAMLTEALEFVSRMVSENKTILLVGTKDQVRAPVAKLGLDLGLPYINNRWLGGTLTNFSVIKRLIKNYLDLKEKKETGKLTKYTKKEQLEFSRQIAKLDRMVGGIASLKKLPDVIFIWDIKHERTALAEAKKKGVPVVAVCDTNVDPTGVKYVIPGNDDATKTVKLVLDYLRQAISEGKAQAKTAKPAGNGQGAKKQ